MTRKATSIPERTCLSCIVLALAVMTASAQVEEYHFPSNVAYGGRSVGVTVKSWKVRKPRSSASSSEPQRRTS